MSRIGKKPVTIPKGVKIVLTNGNASVEGPKGKMSLNIPDTVTLEIKDDKVFFNRRNDTKNDRAAHGLIRNLINNMLIGVSQGYTKKLDIEGVGYKALMKGKAVQFSLGYSHTITYDIPAGLTLTLPTQTSVVITGIDKTLVGQAAANIRKFSKPEPYKGKGVRYSDEKIRRKQGKVVG
jgi:large subunit ribosomal protein L6